MPTKPQSAEEQLSESIRESVLQRYPDATWNYHILNDVFVISSDESAIHIIGTGQTILKAWEDALRNILPAE